MSKFLVLTRVVTAFIGLFPVYFYFAYDSEKQRCHDWVVEIWIGIHARAKETDSKATAILSTVAELVETRLNSMFGSKLLSAQAVGVSSSLSLGTACIAVALSIAVILMMKANILPNDRSVLLGVATFCVICGLLFIGLALLPVRLKSRWVVPVTWIPLGIVIVPSIVVALVLMIRHAMTLPIFLNVFPLGMFFSLASDILVLSIIRKMLRYVSKANNVGAIAMAIFIQLAVIVFILAIPLLPGIYGLITSNINLTEVAKDTSAMASFKQFASFSLASSFFLNLSTVLIALIPVLTLAVILWQRLFWHCAGKLIYLIERHQVLKSNGFLFVFALLCFSYAFHLNLDTLKILLKL
jgi:hypothetical protein